jgi:prepilin-type N-terminal cleavage/methylation domain-containing protein
MKSLHSVGFSLVEIMIVVVLIGLLAALAVPGYQKLRLQAQATSIAEGLRVYAHAFEVYAMEHGKWPADRKPSQIPPEMEGRLSRFDQLSVVGGSWDWEGNASGVTAGVSHRLRGADIRLLRTVDAKLDDGNPSTGEVRLISPGQLTYVLVP